MDIVKIRRQMRSIPARVGGAVHLGTMVGNDVAFEVAEFFEDSNPAVLNIIFPGIEEEDIEAIEDGNECALSEIVGETGRFGWVVRVEVPVFDDMGVGHWGSYTWSYFYGDTYEEAVENGVKWAKGQKAKSK